MNWTQDTFGAAVVDNCIFVVGGLQNFGAYRLEFSSSIRQLVGLGGLFCQLNGPEQESLVTTI